MRRPTTRHARIGRERAALLRIRLGSELRLARTTGGVTQSQLARLAGVSQAFVSFVEGGKRGADLATACAMVAAAGAELSLRVFPGRGIPLRDSGQLELVGFIANHASHIWTARMEQPLGDRSRRAADLVLIGPEQVLHVEVERSLVDLQAQLRSAQLKREELQQHLGRPARLIIALPATRLARRLLAQVGPELRRALPAGTAAAWRAITTGSRLADDGILLVPRHASHRGHNRQ